MNKSSFFIVGQHAVIEALKNPKRKVLRVFLTEESKKNIHRKSPKKNLLEDVKVYFKTKKELDKYSTKENLQHQGYVAEIEQLDQLDLKDFIKDKKNITLACIDEVTDPRNIGSLIRSAASFNLDGLIIKERHFPKESKLMYKAASGCMEHLNIFQVSNINSSLKNLREKNFWIYGFDTRGLKDFTEIKWEGNNVLLFGSEGFGMKHHTSKYVDFLVKIKMNDKIDSLNISNSAAIVFHHIDHGKKK
jgi:23S rRNA (guanosine2251-2'-O)-methyltransferase